MAGSRYGVMEEYFMEIIEEMKAKFKELFAKKPARIPTITAAMYFPVPFPSARMLWWQIAMTW